MRLQIQYGWFLFGVFIFCILNSVAWRVGLISERTMDGLVLIIGFGVQPIGIWYFFRRRKLKAIERSQLQAIQTSQKQ